MAEIFRSAEDFKTAVGRQLGPTDWLTIDQQRIDAFAEATGDHQWIHVDTERAKAGPYGGTIAHGYLTLSLVNHFLPELIRPEGMKLGINYGCDRVRFPGIVRSGTRVRARAEILGTEEVGPGAVQVKIRVSIEVESAERPACVADTLSRFYFQ
jgi:acyl dehydratase